MRFAIKGTEAEWNKALNGQEIGSSGMVQIKSKASGGPTKRKLNQEDIDKEAGLAPKDQKKKKKSKKHRK